MKTFALLLAYLVFFTAIECSAKPITLVEDGYDEKKMVAASERAIREVDFFIKDLKLGRSNHYSVKVPIEEDGTVEHFWLIDIVFSEDKFFGTINNDPGMVSNVKFGQKWSVGKNEISDWMYMRNGKMYGNYTIRPLLATMPEEQAKRFRAIFATP